MLTALPFNLINITNETTVKITKVMSNTISIRFCILLNIPGISSPRKIRFEYMNAIRHIMNEEYEAPRMFPCAPR